MAEYPFSIIFGDKMSAHDNQLIRTFDEEGRHAIRCVIKFRRIIDISQRLHQQWQMFNHFNWVAAIQRLIELLERQQIFNVVFGFIQCGN